MSWYFTILIRDLKNFNLTNINSNDLNFKMDWNEKYIHFIESSWDISIIHKLHKIKKLPHSIFKFLFTSEISLLGVIANVT